MTTSYIRAVYGTGGPILWDIYIHGKWVGSRRTYFQAIRESISS